MACIVQKYGGSSVADVDRLRKIARLIADVKSRDIDIAVVVSAMGQTTDELIAKAREISPKPPRREMDMLLSTGERITMALLCMALHELGFDAVRIPYVEFLAKKISVLSKKGILQDVKPIITARCFVGMVFDCSLNLNLWKGMAGKPYQPNMLINNNIPIYVRGLLKK